MKTKHKYLFSFSPNQFSFNKLCKRVIKRNNNEIKKNTKKLVLSSENYSEYFNSFNKITKISSFLTPNRTKNNSLDKMKISSNDLRNENKKKMKLSKKFNLNFFNKKHLNFKTENNKINCFSDTFILYDDENYSKLKYDEKKIFTRLNHQLVNKYKKYINEKINYLKKNENLNLTDKLYKSFEDEEISLKINLKSMKLSFNNLTDKTKKSIKFYFPFTYLPLFYFNDFQVFKYILLSLIQFDEKQETITLNEEKLREFLQTSHYFKKKSNLKHISVKLNLSLNEIENNEQFKNENGDIYFFIWNTSKYTYKVQLSLPQIEIYFININFYTYLYIERDIMLFLLMINFLDWDFYIMKYLISYKKFRIFYIKNNSKIINFHNILDKLNQYIIFPKIVNYIDKSNIQKYFLYFNTDKDNINSIYIIFSFKLEVQKYQKKFLFSFTFFQTKILSIISGFQDLYTFFLKILNANSELQTVTLDYSYFTFFNERDFKKYFPKDEILLNEDLSNKNNISYNNNINILNNFNNNQLIKFISSNSMNLSNDILIKTDRTTNIQKFNILMTNPIIEKKQIIMNEIESSCSQNIQNEILIQNFIKLFNFPKEQIPSFLVKNYSSMINIKDNNDYEDSCLTTTTKLKKLLVKKKLLIDNDDSNKKLPFVKLKTGINFKIKESLHSGRTPLSPKRKSGKLIMKRMNTSKNYKS